jgi:hypothetical protein
MQTCYSFHQFIFDKGIFDTEVDATYIIHLEGNGRLESIQTQLSLFPPTRHVFLLKNKGYKKCEKKKTITTPPLDLIDAFLQTFQHAQNNHFDNILVLEDDFFWNNDLPNHSSLILSFLNKKRGEPFVYKLGCLPFFMIPYDFYNYWNLCSCGSHASIYSRSYREYVLSLDPTIIKDWDSFNILHSFYFNYTYYQPMCYQLFPNTDNSNFWGYDHFFLFYLFVQFFKGINYLLGLDHSLEPGYTFYYGFSKGIFLILLFVFFYFIFWSLYKLKFLIRKHKSIHF